MSVNNKFILIGIRGEIGSGKDTVASLFQELLEDGGSITNELRFSVYRLKFASFMKQVVKSFLGKRDLDIEDRNVKDSTPPVGCDLFLDENGQVMTVRDIILKIGAGELKDLFFQKEVNNIYKIRADFEKQKSTVNSKSFALIFDDLRTKAQYDKIREMNGYVVSVYPVGFPEKPEDVSVKRGKKNAIENELDDVYSDFIIENFYNEQPRVASRIIQIIKEIV